MSDDYANLQSLVDDVVKEAILAELRVYGWYPTGDGHVQYSVASLGPAPPPVAGPGQGYPQDPVSPNGGYAEPGYDGGPVPSLGAVYQQWENDIHAVFQPFFGFPEPGSFQSLADEVRQALKQLSSQGHTGSGTSSTGSADSANVDYEGNTTLGLANQVAQQLNTWQGAAATSFATYLNLFQVVVGNQALAAEVLRMTLFMEKEMWTRLRSDVATFAHDAASAFRATGGFTADDVKALLSVAGSVSTVLGWFPAFAPITGAADKAMTVTGLVVDTFAGDQPPPNNLGSHSFRDVFSKVKSHASDLKKTSHTVESDIQKTLRNLRSHVAQAPAARSNGTTDQESFRLDRPNATYSAGRTSDFIFPQVTVNPASVKNAADILDQDLAPEMASAGTALGEGDSAWQWWRDDGSIGVGNWGAYDDYSAASYLLQKEITETSKEMGWAAEMLRAVLQDITGVDHNVGGDFGKVRKEIDTYDNPPPVVPSYGGRPMRLE
jgi:uncharacterized protein YukE